MPKDNVIELKSQRDRIQTSKRPFDRLMDLRGVEGLIREIKCTLLDGVP